MELLAKEVVRGFHESRVRMEGWRQGTHKDPTDGRDLAPGTQSVQPVNSLYFSITFTAAFAGPKSVIWVPTAFDADTK